MSEDQNQNLGEREEADGAEYFEPNEEFVKIIVAMGVSRQAAVKALYFTGNKSADLAASWIFENQNSDSMDETGFAELCSSDEDENLDEAYKMVFLVNTGLQMGVGKIAAQVGHAALGMHRLMLQDENRFGDMLVQWEEYGETKIVLKVDSSEQLVAYENKAKSVGLPTYLVHDAGRTQIAPNSTTVLAIMGKICDVDQVTGSLKLL